MTIHLIGVGGISMRALALYLKEQGHQVTGCDLVPIDLPGVPVALGHDPAHIQRGVDQVILSSAITEGSPAWPEIMVARTHKIPSLKRAQVVGEITKQRPTIAISGTHGKSTTTGMIAKIFTTAGRDPFVMIGATLPESQELTHRLGRGPFILEADEFDRSFHQFFPELAVLTNLEADHLDYYTGGLPEIVEAFAEFVRRVPLDGHVVVNDDDPKLREVLTKAGIARDQIVTFGRQETAQYQVSDRGSQEQINYCQIRHDKEVIELALPVPGRHNQMNAAAAVATAALFGIPQSVSQQALADYRGLGRRFEILHDGAGLTIISDYGHHPREIASTIAAARTFYPDRRVVIIFQPHQYARTKHFFREFVETLATADRVIVTDIFAVAGREEERSVRAEDLAEQITDCRGQPGDYLPIQEIANQFDRVVAAHDVVLFMGAGREIDQLARIIAKRIIEDKKN